MSLKLSHYVVATPVLDDACPLPQRILFSTRSCRMFAVDEPNWQRLQLAAIDELPAHLCAELVDGSILVPDDENELKSVLDENRRAAADQTTLSLVIMPTAACQLSCGYCGQLHSQRWLSDEHQDRFLALARARLATGRYRTLFIRWFGAEPLSGLGVIRRFSPRLQALAAEFGCDYGSRIVTNGLALTTRVADELVHRHKVTMFDLTLDGPPEHHDVRRMQKSGKATFDRIFKNVVALARLDLPATLRLRMNVDRSNRSGILPLVRLLAAEGVQDRIMFYLAPIHAWGNDADERSLSPQEFASVEIETFCEMASLGFSIGVLPQRATVVCMAVEPAATLVDATGTLFNCTEVPYVPAYGTPNRFAIGDVASGEVGEGRKVLGQFNDRVERGEYPCATCPMLPVCGGACPKAWLESDPPCPSALHNISARLVLAAAAGAGAPAATANT